MFSAAATSWHRRVPQLGHTNSRTPKGLFSLWLIRTPYFRHSYAVSRVMLPTPFPKVSSKAFRGVLYPSPERNRAFW